MPNLSIYEEDENGVDTDRFYTMNRYVTSPVAAQATHLGGQYNLENPVAVAHQAKRDESTIKLSPEFILKYDVLGTHDDQTKLTYEGQVIFDIYNQDNNKIDIIDNCPSCDGILYVRNGKKGPFLGCSHFPKCKQTRDLTDE